MSNLVVEVALRLLKLVLASLVGLVVYVVLVGPLGVAASAELALLCWLTGAATVLLVETGLF